MERDDQRQAGPEGPQHQDRYPADQQFGAAAARDEELLDRAGGEIDPTGPAVAEDRPRAANKAEPAGG